MIYLDHNATTPLDERVLEAMLPFLKTMYGNPSSTHRLGRIAKSAIEIAREQIAAFIDAPSANIIFTSGGTEANNLAINLVSPTQTLAVSTTEHPCIIEPAQRFQQNGGGLELIEVNAEGEIDASSLMASLKKRPALVSIMLANNETGVIQPIEKIANRISEQGIFFHTDAVQALGKIPVSFQQLGVQMLSLSSHKIYGPKGCGALVVDKKIEINPLLLGGGQEKNDRSGTENVAAIVGFGKAAELAATELFERSDKMRQLRDLLESELTKIPRVTIFAKESARLPNTTLFGVEGIDGELILLKADQQGFALSSGSACASQEKEPSPILLAMGVSPQQARTAIRVSLGYQNTHEDILKLIDFINHLTKFGV
jgi:cysteine desulfurase